MLKQILINDSMRWRPPRQRNKEKSLKNPQVNRRYNQGPKKTMYKPFLQPQWLWLENSQEFLQHLNQRLESIDPQSTYKKQYFTVRCSTDFIMLLVIGKLMIDLQTSIIVEKCNRHSLQVSTVNIIKIGPVYMVWQLPRR